MLIDSGSSSTFISSTTAASLKCKVTSTDPIQVQEFTWWTQGHTFSTDARVFDLPYYDLVLGMDWLETHSPMWIHWKRKLLRFTYQWQRISLKGVKDQLSTCPKVKARKIKGLLRKGGIAQMIHLCQADNVETQQDIPPSVQEVVEQHAHLFKTPDSLPP